MRRLWTLAAILAVAGWALGCGGADTDQADTGNDEPAAQAQDEAADDAGDMAEAPAIELASVSVSGTLGCGHCTFHIGESCALAMEAQDGTVYMLDAGDRQEELMEVRYDRPEVKVAGRLADKGGQKIIVTESVEIL